MGEIFAVKYFRIFLWQQPGMWRGSLSSTSRKTHRSKAGKVPLPGLWPAHPHPHVSHSYWFWSDALLIALSPEGRFWGICGLTFLDLRSWGWTYLTHLYLLDWYPDKQLQIGSTENCCVLVFVWILSWWPWAGWQVAFILWAKIIEGWLECSDHSGLGCTSKEREKSG